MRLSLHSEAEWKTVIISRHIPLHPTVNSLSAPQQKHAFFPPENLIPEPIMYKENKKNSSREEGDFRILSSAKTRTRHGGGPPNGNNKPQLFLVEAKPLPSEPETSVHSPGLLPAALPGKSGGPHSHGERLVNSLPLCWPLLLQLYSHRGPAGMCEAVGAGGAGVSSKAGSTWWQGMSRPCAPQGPGPSINSSPDGFCSGLL